MFAERALAEAAQADGRRGSGDRRPLLGVPVAIKDDTDVAGEVTARGTNAFGEPARAGRRGRAPPARGRRRDRRQDQRPRARDHAVHRDARRSARPATRGTSTARRAARAAARRRRSRPASPAARSAPTAAARSASRPAAAASSASRRSAAGSRSRRRTSAWHGLSVYGPIVRRVADAALFIDATSDGEPLAPAVERGAPGGCGSRSRPSSPPPILGGAGRRAARGASTPPPSCCAGSATRSPSAIPTTGRAGRRSPRATSAGSTTRRARWRTPSGCRGARAGFMRLGAAIAPPVARARARATGPPPRALRPPVRAGRRPAHPDVHAPPDPDRRRTRAAARCGPSTATRAGCRTRAPFNHTGQPAASVPVGFTPDGFPLAVQLVGRPGDEATLLSLAAQIEHERPWADRVPDAAERAHRARRADRARGGRPAARGVLRRGCRHPRPRAARPTWSPRPTSPPRR